MHSSKIGSREVSEAECIVGYIEGSEVDIPGGLVRSKEEQILKIGL